MKTKSKPGLELDPRCEGNRFLHEHQERGGKPPRRGLEPERTPLGRLQFRPLLFIMRIFSFHSSRISFLLCLCSHGTIVSLFLSISVECMRLMCFFLRPCCGSSCWHPPRNVLSSMILSQHMGHSEISRLLVMRTRSTSPLIDF